LKPAGADRVAFVWGKLGLPSSGKITGSGLGVWRGPAIVAAAALVLLPIDAGNAGWLSDLFSPAKPATSPKREAAPKPATPAKPSAQKPSAQNPAAPSTSHVAKPAAPKPGNLKPVAVPVATKCSPAKFRIILDVGHTAQSEGAMSSRNIAEFVFNLRLAKRIEQKLKAEGFGETRLLVTEGKARASLVKRVAAANNMNADLFLSIHHDSVPKKFIENWEFEGKKSRFSDRFSGYSVFVSKRNPDFKTSLAFAELVAKEMKGNGLKYAEQYSQAIMGRYRRPLLNKETGVYSFDELIVLRKTKMAAVLLEGGSIINRDEELKMDSTEHRNTVSSAVAAALKEFCDPRWAMLGPL
jgi:N-acetylmuramoyl-L-alanine amidase